MLKTKKKKAQSTLEYIFLLILIMASFFIFQKYIFRGLAGRWKTAGDSFSHGRRYVPGKTIECFYDHVYTDQWVNLACYETNNCEPLCEQFSIQFDNTLCSGCINGCLSPAFCDP